MTRNEMKVHATLSLYRCKSYSVFLSILLKFLVYVYLVVSPIPLLKSRLKHI